MVTSNVAPTQVATPSIALSPDQVTEIDRVWQARYSSVSGLVVRHNDTVIYENYDRRQSADQFMEIYSVTKSVTAILTGIALYNGDLTSLDLLVADLIPEYMAAADPQLQTMTVEHLLLMASGLRSGWNLEGSPINSYRGDLHERALALGYANDPGEVAFYNTLATSLLTGVLEAAVGQDLESYAETELFEPLDMEWEWYRDDTDRVTTAAGLRLRTRDMTKLGQLVLNEGVWEGERLLSAEYLATATTPINQISHWLGGEQGYGYLWWIPDSHVEQQLLAFGFAGQIIYILPKHNLVVAMSSPCCRGSWNSIELVHSTILPALQRD